MAAILNAFLAFCKKIWPRRTNSNNAPRTVSLDEPPWGSDCYFFDSNQAFPSPSEVLQRAAEQGIDTTKTWRTEPVRFPEKRLVVKWGVDMANAELSDGMASSVTRGTTPGQGPQSKNGLLNTTVHNRENTRSRTTVTQETEYMADEIDWDFGWEAQLVEELGREFKLLGPVIFIQEHVDGPEPAPIKAKPIAVDARWKAYMTCDILNELDRREAMLIMSQIERTPVQPIDEIRDFIECAVFVAWQVWIRAHFVHAALAGMVSNGSSTFIEAIMKDLDTPSKFSAALTILATAYFVYKLLCTIKDDEFFLPTASRTLANKVVNFAQTVSWISSALWLTLLIIFSE